MIEILHLHWRYGDANSSFMISYHVIFFRKLLVAQFQSACLRKPQFLASYNCLIWQGIRVFRNCLNAGNKNMDL